MEDGAGGANRGRGTGPTLAAISRSMVQLLRRSVGRGPTRAKTYWAGSDILLVVLSGGYLQSERTLRETGHGDTVEATRKALQDALEQDMRGIVEELTGRSVVAFLSASSLDPEVSAELFFLRPEAEPAARPEAPEAAPETA
jgi:uncharacterized protein YbcI